MRYVVRVVNPNSGLSALQLDAGSENEARAQARLMGYTVLGVRERGLSAFRFSRFPLLLFSQELIALLQAGLGVIEALQALAEKQRHAESREVLGDILARLAEGKPFSAALQGRPEVFPSLYIATVRASEKTGDLVQALGRYVAYETQMQDLRSRLISASISPVMLIGVGVLVTGFLLGYVVPKFAAVFEDLGQDQPLASRLLIEFGSFIGNHGGAAMVLLAGALAMSVGVIMNRAVRRRLSEALARLPVIGEKLAAAQIARLYRTCGMLLCGGIPAIAALQMASGLLPERLRASLDLALRDIREGKPLSDVMESRGLTTPVAARMLRVGERTGEMGAMMERIASFHEAEVARWVDRAARLCEPLLMIATGAVIGFIVLALYMPIFDLAGNLQ